MKFSGLSYLIYIATTWHIFTKSWDGSWPGFHHLRWNDPELKVLTINNCFINNKFNIYFDLEMIRSTLFASKLNKHSIDVKQHPHVNYLREIWWCRHRCLWWWVLRHSIFNFFNHKNFFRPILEYSLLQKKIFIFWNSNIITNFESRTSLLFSLLKYICLALHQQASWHNGYVICIVLFMSSNLSI